jgi:uncharacterized protein YggT (Ycf19 family)
MGIVTPMHSPLHLAGQCLLLGGALVFSVRYLLPGFILLHLVASYVFLGNNPFWEFAITTSRNLLKPLERLPLRFGRVDLAPVVGLLLIVGILFYPLPAVVQHFLDKDELTLWPS